MQFDLLKVAHTFIQKHKTLTLLALSTQLLFAPPNPFNENDVPKQSQFVSSSSNANTRVSSNSKLHYEEDGSVFTDTDFEEGDVPENEYTNQIMFLDSVQKHFWNPKRKLQDNNKNIMHRSGDTHMIRTRYQMVTTIIFDDDPIAKVIFGDPKGFEITELGKDKFDLSNIITIKPKLIGIDTNLTVIGESGTIYTFYIFSTHFTNRRDPAFTVFVSKERPIGMITMTNLEEEGNKKSKNKKWQQNYKSIEYEAIEEDDGEFLSIGDNVNKLHIEKRKIERGYGQKPRHTRSWKQLWLKKNISPIAQRMQAVDVFNDNEYTYFKFDRENALSKFPTVYKVIDGYDNPVNVKIVGNYIIAEDINDKWTLKMGDEYVCIEKFQKPFIVTREVEPKEDPNKYIYSNESTPANQEAQNPQATVYPQEEILSAEESREMKIQQNQKRIEELEKALLQKSTNSNGAKSAPKASSNKKNTNNKKGK